MSDNLEISQKSVLTEKVFNKKKLIKLHIPGESFWAYQLKEDTAEICNILMSFEYGFKDIVKFDPNDNNEVLCLIEKKTNTYGIKYKSTNETIKDTYKVIVEHFVSKGIDIEGLSAGFSVLAVPVGISEKTIVTIVKECPIKLEFIS